MVNARNLAVAIFCAVFLAASIYSQDDPQMLTRVPDKPSLRQSQNPQTTPAKKRRPVAEGLSDMEISDARKLLNQLGYWVSLEATGNDGSLRHAMTAFQKIEGRKRTGILTREEIDVLRGARRPKLLESEYPILKLTSTGRFY